MRHVFRVFVLISIVIAWGCAETPSAPSDARGGGETVAAAAKKVDTKRCSLLMGWDPWEPYQYRDVDGRMRGLDVELAQAILSDVGCTLRFEEGRWSTLVRQLQEGKIDMLMGATRTPSRESYAYFSAPYRDEDFKLYVRKGEAVNFPVTDLRQLLETRIRVGVTEQYVYGDAVTRLQGDPNFADLFVGATIGELNQQRLLRGEIEGFLEDPFVMAQAMRNKGLNAYIEAHPLKVHSGKVTMMFSQASVSKEVVDAINASIVAMQADGRLQAIVNKYLR